MLGATLALLSAASFAFNMAAARRGMVTGSPSQAMAISVPIGVACFAVLALALGQVGRSTTLGPTAMAWMAAMGVLHFVFGRFCNYRASQLAGSNLTVPVLQLNLIVTLALAVIVLHESCSALQMIGGVLVLLGSLVTQRQGTRPAGIAASRAQGGLAFEPRRLAGCAFAALAALAYGTSPVVARLALADSGTAGGILGGLIAYASASAVVGVSFLWPSIRRHVFSLDRHNAKWFAYSGLAVALAQAFFFAAVAVAPIMVVVPLLQLSAVFLLIVSRWLNPQHEVMGPLVMLGVACSIAGALAISIDTGLILDTLRIPEPIARILRWRV